MKTRRSLAVLMAATMVTGMLAGCGGSSDSGSGSDGSSASGTETGSKSESTGDMVSLTFVYPVMTTMAGQDEVNAKIAELAREELNIDLTVMPLTFSECMSQTPLMIQSGEQIDVFPWWAQLAGNFVENGYLLDLTDYVDNMPNSLEWVTREDIECCNVGGYIWGVTTMRERCNPQAICMRKDILDELGINPDDIKTLDDITNVFAQVKEAHPEMTILSGASTEGLGNGGDMAYNCDPLNDKFGVLDNYGAELKVVNEFETEFWQNLIYTVRDWYNAGYVSKDMASSTDSGATQMLAGNLFAYCDNYKPDSEQEKMQQYGLEAVEIPITQPLQHTTSVSGLAYCVNGTTEHPDEAVKLLDWLFGSKEVNNLLNWGIEGVDYVLNDEGTVSYPEGVDASNVSYHLGLGWAIPNQFVGNLWEGNDPNLYEIYKEWRNSAQKSAAFGFSFDSSSVTDEVIACKAVYDQYLPPLTTGTVDPKTGIEEFNQALYDAGLQTIMDEKQRQLDEWAASNK